MCSVWVCMLIGRSESFVLTLISEGHCARYPQVDAANSRLSGQVKSTVIGIAPVHVVGMFGPTESSQMLAVCIQYPEPTRPAYIDVSSFINFDTVNCILARSMGHIEKQLSLPQCAIGIYWISKNDFVGVIPVAN